MLPYMPRKVWRCCRAFEPWHNWQCCHTLRTTSRAKISRHERLLCRTLVIERRQVLGAKEGTKTLVPPISTKQHEEMEDEQRLGSREFHDRRRLVGVLILDRAEFVVDEEPPAVFLLRLELPHEKVVLVRRMCKHHRYAHETRIGHEDAYSNDDSYETNPECDEEVTVEERDPYVPTTMTRPIIAIGGYVEVEKRTMCY